MVALSKTTLPDQADIMPMDIFTWLLLQSDEDPMFDITLMALWLDPMQSLIDMNKYDLRMAVEESEDAFLAALYLARTEFLHIYFGLVDEFWTRERKDFERLVIQTMDDEMPSDANDYHAQDTYQYLYFPLEFYGISLDGNDYDDYYEEDVAASYPVAFSSPEMLEVFSALGWELNQDQRFEDLGDSRFRGEVLKLLETSLLQATETHKHSVFDNLVILLQWIQGRTGNSLMDWQQEAWHETGGDHLPWSEQELGWGLVLNAWEMRDMADAAIEALQQDFVLRNALISNYRMFMMAYQAENLMVKDGPFWKVITIKEFEDGKLYSNHYEHFAQWPEPSGQSRTGLTDAQIEYRNLRTWRDAAYTDCFLLR
jgi:hypothetical protein